MYGTSTLLTVGNAKDWLTEIVDRARQLTVSGGFETGTDIGPVISRDAQKRIEDLIQSTQDEGATILVDGRGYKPPGEQFKDGYFVSPETMSAHKTLLIRVTHR